MRLHCRKPLVVIVMSSLAILVVPCESSAHPRGAKRGGTLSAATKRVRLMRRSSEGVVKPRRRPHVRRPRVSPRAVRKPPPPRCSRICEVYNSKSLIRQVPRRPHR